MGVRPDLFRLTGPRPQLDPRRFIARDGLVEIALADRVAAARYVAPWRQRCRVAGVAMRDRPEAAAPAVSELLFGEVFDLFDVAGDWALGRSCHDDYVGWVPVTALRDGDAAAEHRVTARGAPVFESADIKSPVRMLLPFGAPLAGEMQGSFLALADGGHVHGRHVAALARREPVAVARQFLGAPYLWGGRTPAGVDCSGLVQAALAACGMPCPRDSDQQRAAIGTAVAFNERAAGDIVFFPGHVGLLACRDTLLHANAWWMTTLIEPLADVIARLHATGVEQPVLAVKRLQTASPPGPLTSA